MFWDVLEWAFNNYEVLPLIFMPIGILIVLIAYFRCK
jgi:hypothetical protein